MNLSPSKEHDLLHRKLLSLSKQHRRVEAEILDHLQEADRTRLYLIYGHASLFRYVADELGYSDSVTSNMIAVARKTMEVPRIKEEIRKGNLGIAKLRKVVPVIDQENQDEWIDTANTSSSRELELKVAEQRENYVPKASVRAVAKDTLRLSLDISLDSREKLDQLRDILSTKKGRDCTLQEVFDFALETTLDKVDPIRKAKRSEKRKAKKSEPVENETTTEQKPPAQKSTYPRTHSSRRKSLPQRVVDQINSRDKRRCVYMGPGGKRCTQTRWLHFHHVLPVSKGGANHPNNLVTICSRHHSLIHHDS